MNRGSYPSGLLALFALAFLACPALVHAQPHVIWQREIGISRQDYALGLEICENGDYLFISSMDYQNHVVDRVSPDGIIVGSTDILDSQSGYELEMIESGYFLAQTYLHDPDSSYTMIYNSMFEPIMTSDTYPGSGGSAHRCRTGGFIACGDSYTTHTAYTTKLSPSGEVVWSLAWPNLYSGVSSFDVASDHLGNIYDPLNYYYGGSETVIRLVKLSSDGSILWITEYPESNNPYIHYVGEVSVRPDGNIHMCGVLDIEPDTLYSVMNVTPDGDVVDYFGAIDDLDDICQMHDGGYLAINISYPNFLIFTRYTASGDPLYSWTHEVSTNPDIEWIERIFAKTTPDDEVIVFGCYYYNLGGGDYDYNPFAVKMDLGPTDLQLEVQPLTNTSVISAPGQFFWSGTLTNTTNANITTDVWVLVRGPAGYPSEPLWVWQDINIPVPANGRVSAILQQDVPADAETGQYNYIVRVGDYDAPGGPRHTIQAYFPLRVVDGAEVDLDPPRVHGVVAAPLAAPTLRKR